MVAHGMLFAVVEWIDHGKPTQRPENKHTSAFESAVMAPNLSMTQVLWERAWQEQRDAVSAFGHLAWQRTSDVVMRYLLENGCPVDHVATGAGRTHHGVLYPTSGKGRAVVVGGYGRDRKLPPCNLSDVEHALGFQVTVNCCRACPRSLEDSDVRTRASAQNEGIGDPK